MGLTLEEWVYITLEKIKTTLAILRELEDEFSLLQIIFEPVITKEKEKLLKETLIKKHIDLNEIDDDNIIFSNFKNFYINSDKIVKSKINFINIFNYFKSVFTSFQSEINNENNNLNSIIENKNNNNKNIEISNIFSMNFENNELLIYHCELNHILQTKKINKFTYNFNFNNKPEIFPFTSSNLLNFNNKLLISGGFCNNFPSQSTLILQKDSLNNFNFIPFKKMIFPRVNHITIFVPNKKNIYFIGGKKNSTCEFLNLNSNKFNKFPSLNICRENSSVFLINNYLIFVVGGFNEKNYLNGYEMIDVSYENSKWNIFELKDFNGKIRNVNMKFNASFVENEENKILCFGNTENKNLIVTTFEYSENKKEIYFFESEEYEYFFSFKPSMNLFKFDNKLIGFSENSDFFEFSK